MPTLTLMAVHAHPDDECSSGGTLARYAAEGCNTVLVTCTKGEEGEIVDPDMDTDAVKPRLGDVRVGELNAAAGILGVGHLELLGYRDSGMAGTASNEDPRSFNKADPDEVTGRLVALIRKHRPHVLFTYAEDGGYGHPDHIMAHRITVAAFDAAGEPERYPEAGAPWTPQKLYFCTWMMRARFQALWRALKERGLPIPYGDADATEPPERGVPDELITTRVDVRPFIQSKLDSYRAHRSQIRPDRGVLQFANDLNLAQEFIGIEGFIRARTRVAAPDQEDDLFAGLRNEPAAVSRRLSAR